MNKFLVIFAALSACAWAYNRYEPSYVQFESEEDNDDDYSKPMPYGFEYDVNDGHNNFGHRQQSDGRGVTTGSYRVQLPDGRTQIVTYRADENGYNAKVTYEQTPTTPPPTLPAYYYNPAAAYIKAPKPLIYRTATTTTTPFSAPFYEFPSIPPYGAYQTSSYYTPAYGSTTTTTPSTNNEEDSDEESPDSRLPLTPLLFRKNVEQISRDDSRIPLLYRSGYSKRSPINLTSDAEAISEVVIEQVTPAVEVESQTDSVLVESITSGYEEVEFDHLPFPLPVPLAFRPDAL